MSYKITIINNGNHISNPLLGLAGREYKTHDEACDAIYDALYNVIDSDNGCEMVDKSRYTLDSCRDEDGNIMPEMLDEYDNDCRNYIYNNDCASEDGVSATVEECED